ncbi:hypothetical protein QFC22_001446 [Naganishia vaughanmartiniae]|uniref:Uncharacterized protein n=1 Tax=Naganishia vaughanmartiniae TaxID=1424756 RepID=A0ACC2XGU9_9TREE|nr:hypothetical protein QFC22_001446 [Naganishia vaughanmartiniae]
MSLSHRTIDPTRFNDVLSRYDAQIQETSDSKQKRKTTDNNDTLAVLDEWRLNILPQVMKERRDGKGGDNLKKLEVEKLIRWKLMHGTFRPSLMKLVSSNEESKIEDVTGRAFEVVSLQLDAARQLLSKSIREAILVLTELRGIGPASASLLLGVRFPKQVPFFSDEAYRWLTAASGNHWTVSIKYNAKEYAVMLDSCLCLAERLRVNAVDIERVGWVLGREKADLNESTLTATGSNRDSTTASGSKRKEEEAELDIPASSEMPVMRPKRSKRQ